MRLNHKLLCLMLFLLPSAALFAQQKKITGTVTDEQGMPLPGVNVIVEGTTNGTQTDFEGTYELQASEGEILNYSFMGMETVSMKIGNTNVINVVLKPNSSELKEIIITAVGIEREKSSLGSATTTVDSEELVKGSQSNIADALKGKISGVNISSASSDPGASSGVIIRGMSSLSGSNQPLYVVDGIPINNESTYSSDLNGGYDFGRGSQDINPDNIASLTVLKGASATALYGSRAANGVIIITTKKGKAGNLVVDLSSSSFFSQISRTPNYQSMYGQGWNASHWLEENGSWGPKFDGKLRLWGNEVDYAQQFKPFLFQEDQLENFFTTGTYYLNNGSISGGSETTTARLSFSNLKQDGIFPTDADSFERNTVGVSAQSQIGIIAISGNLNYVNSEGAGVATGQGITVYNNLMQIPTDLDITSFKDYHNRFNNVSNYYTPYGVTNPYFSLNENGSAYNKERVYGSLDMKVTINKWSNLVYRVGLDQSASKTRIWNAIVEAEPGSPNADSSTEQTGSYSETYDMVRQINHDVLYDVDASLSDNLQLQSTTGLNINSRNSSWLNASVGSQIIPGFFSLTNSGENPLATSYRSERKLYGIYNNTTLNYRNFLYLTGNIRNDWYSTLPKENRSVLYGGVNASWLFSRSLFQENGILTYGKLRAGYGEVGVDTDPYQISSNFIPKVGDNQGFGDLRFPLGGYLGYEVGNRAPNPDLRPERRKEFEIGLDLEFFRDRISLDVTYYNALVEDQILALPLSPSSGYKYQIANLGSISNEGIEALLGFSLWRNREGFSWDTSINFSKNDSRLKELDDRLDEVELGGLNDLGLVVREGSPIGLLKGSVPETTEDGRIVVDTKGIPVAASEKGIYGDTQYDFTLGVSNDFSYKNLSFGFTLDMREGGLMYSRTADITRFTGNSVTTMYNDREPFIVPNSVQRRVSADGTITYVENTVPVSRANMDDYYSSEALGRATVIDKSFIKLREVVLNYNFPDKVVDRFSLDAFSVSVIGRNLFLWTPEENQFIDPEASTFGTDLESQFGEFSANPSTRSIGLSLKTRF
ncbi:MAG: SusC/RagA family TonB-linked outer membrane protein [Christiangramia sp.]|nr:SusC/RagA family TonB-linked outer membrane protein [Christiangramia sp.]